VGEATTLITVSGTDRPGITAALFALLAEHEQVKVLDIEQVVIRGQLTLGTLISSPDDQIGLRESLAELATAKEIQISVSDRESDDSTSVEDSHLFVTVLSTELKPAALARIAGHLANSGANIERIVRIAAYPITAIEFEISGAPIDLLQRTLSEEPRIEGVDIAVQRGGLSRRGKKLVVMDVDSTLIQDEVIELLAAEAGVFDEVSRITDRAMLGELDFTESLTKRVALLKDLPVHSIQDVQKKIRLTPGARTLIRTLKRLDHQVALVSGGFHEVIDSLAADLGITFVTANRLEIADGCLTGRLIPPIIDRAGKARALETFAERAGVKLSQTVAIGDGANDLDMLAIAGLGVAFNAKQVVKDAADTSVSAPYLDGVLYLLGITREEIENADRDAELLGS
jgi:phosphoserine phosphatase